MVVRKIALMGNPVLRRTAAPVDDPLAPDVQTLISDMIETMEDAQGSGLAAPQVYESRRIIIFHAPAERTGPDEQAPLTVLINPEIAISDQDMEEGWEGCLSVPGLRGFVPRYSHIRYSGIDQNGHLIEREALGFHARVVQHECDHLDGILYPQRMIDLSKMIFESEVRHWFDEEDDSEIEIS